MSTTQTTENPLPIPEPREAPKKPSGTSPRAAAGRCHCGRKWVSLTQCHCPTCHEQFAGVRGFDRHRVAAGKDTTLRECINPATARRKDGSQLFVASHEAFGVVWRNPGMPTHWTRADD